ncbi:bifunctional 5,10-methylenetetrahydrofolate dehydrogenase/5,10-methenyltetrahydrofolate cyclohydrolase [Borrelia sp. RT1S]|uniref:bifunctional 5,10-methylenetetrahydrofolate dehydrogenase/5,10-methenyltetrahydrofolate cyclohydrolase n=1 Tax=Borrelia sp. RT1S TaxID=2898580 RepID=UPI001E59E819|nr:bifunctional 5,10-methylenetetrahydrofolate dehydrogenase/5,10-methenyltetrahydrofolate cyclohydrolase [Borrelia sp. RT1S]UGQ16859.1 bifunctional 5,10-methylenetetrahydrofolate dehydrogenase/5,10-methenyltetrahydrofolate cyclohydrolase [Borrelia sp. RT1S]
MTNIFDGKLFAERYYSLLKKFLAEYDLVNRISLKVILANDNPASRLYVSIKERVSKEIGINFCVIKLSSNAEQENILKLIETENLNEDTDGIIVQLPLFGEINVGTVLNKIVHTKDVDGLSAINLGKLVLGDRKGFVPCTALAVLKVLFDQKVETSGRTVVVIGRSALVGRPISILLSCKPYNATVIVCHSKSTYLDVYVRQADIIISAVGKPKLVGLNMISGNPYVIDIGISELEVEGGGTVLTGDVDFESIRGHVKFITPVRGGIGPVTVLMLMFNTIKAHLVRHSRFDVLEKLEKLVEV